MKRVFTIAAVASLVALTACGPSQAELEAEEQRIQDSIAAAEAEQARLDSIAAAEAEQARLDSIAAAEASRPAPARKAPEKTVEENTKSSKMGGGDAGAAPATETKKSKMSGGAEAVKEETTSKKKSKMGGGK